VLLLETFVDPRRFRGTVYRAANWLHVGDTKGFRRTGKGYSAKTHPPKNAQKVLTTNRGHWSIENSCHYILDWNYDEDRRRISAGYGPENITRLRRFAIGLIKSRGVHSVAQKMRQLTRSVRMVLDYLKMTNHACPSPCP
jgi:hypothetical protein